VRMRALLAVLGSTAAGLGGLFAGGCQGEGASGEQSTLAAGAGKSAEPCPVETAPRVRADVPAVAFAYGKGPVFVGLGTGGGVVRYTVDTRSHDGWYYYKTLWAILPAYAGGVVITGRQIRGSKEVRFNPGTGFPGRKELRLSFPPDDSGKWRYGPSETLIRAPGCYAFHLAGGGV
jgi:hypothetical protein